MEFSTALAAFIEMCALFGPFLLPIVGLYLLNKVLRLWATWDAHRDTDEVIVCSIGGLAMMYLAIHYSIGIIRAPESSGPQHFMVIVTGCCVLILLQETYLQVRTFIKARRTSN